MKKISVLLCCIFLCNCSSGVQLLDSWKANAFRESIRNRVLVIANNPEQETRNSYETIIAKRIRKKGVSAVESHLVFPNLTYKTKRNRDESNRILNQFKEKGFSTVLIISLKATIITEEFNKAENKNYREKYKTSSINLSENSLPKSAITTSYIVESVMYNFNLLNGDELIHVSLIDITNPKSEVQVLKSVSKVIGKQFQY